jgi:hypothetical protein
LRGGGAVDLADDFEHDGGECGEAETGDQ